jgi:HEAT repeat protein
MKKRYQECYENDPTPSREVVERFRAAFADEDTDLNLALVTYRGGEEEFALGVEYATSADPDDRAVGARILGQLGWGDRSYLKKSVRLLIAMLDDPDEDIVSEAASALGHRGDASAIPALLKLAGHDNPSIRYSVTFGLLTHEDPAAIAALVKLTADENRDVRNWATFGLGTQIDADTPEIRAALRKVLADEDFEVRGEALVGLARRADPCTVQALLDEWEEWDDVSLLSLEAAEITRDPRLYNHLKAFAEAIEIVNDVSYLETLQNALKACEPVRDDPSAK